MQPLGQVFLALLFAHLLGDFPFQTGRMVRGPGPSPAVVPSMTANSPLWISFWMARRSTSVAWIQLWV